MADAKISALTGATTPLAGTEEIPVVQGGATRKVSIANLTTGRALSATELTLTTGNLIVSNGKGIDFSATPGTGTSELLDDYEEGDWTPTLTSTGATFGYSVQNGKYTKVGRQVFVTADIYMNAGAGGTLTNALTIATLPFAADTASSSFTSFSMGYMDFVDTPAGHLGVNMYIANGGTTINLGSFIDNTSPAVWTAAVLTNRCRLMFTGVYNTL
jgi:hypothetical protein